MEQAPEHALRERKDRLVEFPLDGRLDQRTYDEQAQRLNAEMEAAKSEFSAADLECMDVETVLEICEQAGGAA